MPSIWVPDDTFAKYLMEHDGDPDAAKEAMVNAVEEEAPE